MQFPKKPKRPRVALMRFYEDIIDEIKEKYPNTTKDSSYHRSIIKELFDKMDKNEKEYKYLIPLQKEKKLYKKKLSIYNQKYKKEIEKIIGKRPNVPYKPFSIFKKIYQPKIKNENPKLYNYQIVKIINKLFKSKEKEKEVKKLNLEYNDKMEVYKKEIGDYKENLKIIFKSDSESSNSSDDDKFDQINLKKRKKYQSSEKKILKIKKKKYEINYKKLETKSNNSNKKENLEDIKKELIQDIGKINLNDIKKINEILQQKTELLTSKKIKDEKKKSENESENINSENESQNTNSESESNSENESSNENSEKESEKL